MTELSCMGQRILRLYNFQFAHPPHTGRHRSVRALVLRAHRSRGRSRWKLLPDLSRISETRAGHRVLSAIQRISGAKTKIRSAERFQITTIGSFSQADM